MKFFLQYDFATAAPINAEAASNFGITNITALYNAALSAADTLQKVCIPVVGIAFLLRFFMIMTKLYSQRQIDFSSLGQFLLLLLFLFNYKELMGQVNSLISYFTDNIQILFDKYGSGHTLVDMCNEVYDKYEETHPEAGIMDGLSHIMDWLVANCTHLIIVISRAVGYITRSLIMLFLFSVGPIAILLTMFPGFEDTLKTWFKYYISVGFWAVTLSVLDLLLYKYLEYCKSTNSIDGMTIINIGMAFMYFRAPYLTGKYIGGQTSMFMSQMVQSATSVISEVRRVGRDSKPMTDYATDKAYDAGKAFTNKISNTLAGGGDGNTLPKATGKLYGKIMNNTINKNQSEH